MKYIGEHLFPGELGHFFAILSLVASLIATISYFKANRLIDPAEKQSWLRFARVAFLVETVAVLGIFSTLYYIISNHYYEYFYAWNHTSRSLQSQYLLASFWEGQEGSFMLWSFWHCVLGWIFTWRSKKWEAPVMTVISFAQFCIATMLLGIFFGAAKVGSDPFILFRHQMPEMPLWNNANYLSFPRIAEGNDLNTLLQNYWMVIHPPVLFLGFASTIIPFGLAYGGLTNKDHSWTKTSLSWACFSGAVLGTGIMMGAAWAYESLSFGGYWAWDPVENASLVPWLVLVAGLHTNLVYKHTGYSLRSTYLFFIFAFSLVLYSTFLTRSGILGDTSVHAFTGADMTLQLVLFLLVFFVPALVLYFARLKSIPTIRKEESTYSREFWMFIGALVLFLASMIITAKTSTPVFNKIFGTNIAPPEDAKFSENQVQIFIAIILGVLTAVTQYLKYKNTTREYFFKKIGLPTIIALVISICVSIFGNINYDVKGIGFLAAIHLAIFAAVYGVVANAAYIWRGLNGKMKSAGASIAHVGFTLFLAGVLISSSKQETLSQNTTGINVFEKTKQEDPAENITLFKGIKTDMGKYDVTYVRDTTNNYDRKKYFELKFASKDGKESFYLYPDVLKNNKGQEGFSPNPDKKHYITNDIFAYVTSWMGSDTRDDTASFKPVAMKPGDTAFYSNGMIILNKININTADFKRPLEAGETPVTLAMTVISKEGKTYSAQPSFAVKLADNSFRNLPDTVVSQNLILAFEKMIDPSKSEIQLGVKEASSNLQDLMTLKVYNFPFIGLVWLGVIIMVFGLLMSMVQRIRSNLPGRLS
jgi:cytochrome c-type biogenesis protein CcmF